jgi:TonB family protein
MMLKVRIEKDGTITSPRVIKSVPAFDQTVVDAARKARVRPVLVHGEPTALDSIYKVRICADEPPPPLSEPSGSTE